MFAQIIYFAVLIALFVFIPIICVSEITKENASYRHKILLMTTICVIYSLPLVIEFAQDETNSVVTFDDLNKPHNKGYFAFCWSKCANIKKQYDVKSAVNFTVGTQYRHISYTINVAPIDLDVLFRSVNISPGRLPLSNKETENAIVRGVEYHLYDFKKLKHDDLSHFDNPRDKQQQAEFQAILADYLTDLLRNMGLKMTDVPQFDVE